MPTITIDSNDYDLDSLSPEAKAQLQMLQIADQEVMRLNAQMALTQTARNAYAKALKEAVVSTGETFKFSK
jgi:hypothetical protein